MFISLSYFKVWNYCLVSHILPPKIIWLKEYPQRRFLHFAGFLLDIPHHLPREYSPIAEHFEAYTLVDRRNVLGIKFLINLLDGKCWFPIPAIINFQVPQRQSTYHVPFFIPFCTTNYLSIDPLMKNVNGDSSFDF